VSRYIYISEEYYASEGVVFLFLFPNRANERDHILNDGIFPPFCHALARLENIKHVGVYSMAGHMICSMWTVKWLGKNMQISYSDSIKKST
jgi:hypothetical protein